MASNARRLAAASLRLTAAHPLAFGALVFALALAPSVARADPTAADKETARSLVKEGDRRFDAKDFGAALKAYQGAHAIMGVPTTGIGLGRAQQALGLLVEARDTFLQVARLPALAREPAIFAKVRAEAEQLAEALADRIPTLRAEVLGPPPGVERIVRLDDVALSPAVAGLPWKVNPGVHRVTASAPGYRESTERAEVLEGKSATVRLVLVALPAARVAEVEPPAVAPPSSAAAGAEGAPRPRRAGAYLAYGGFGLGVAGIAVGSVTGLMHLSKTSDIRSVCPGNACGRDQEEPLQSARTFATISNVAFGVGAVGLGVGVVGLLLTRGSHDEPPAGQASQAGLHVVPLVGDRSVGLGGTF